MILSSVLKCIYSFRFECGYALTDHLCTLCKTYPDNDSLRYVCNQQVTLLF